MTAGFVVVTGTVVGGFPVVGATVLGFVAAAKVVGATVLGFWVVTGAAVEGFVTFCAKAAAVIFKGAFVADTGGFVVCAAINSTFTNTKSNPINKLNQMDFILKLTFENLIFQRMSN